MSIPHPMEDSADLHGLVGQIVARRFRVLALRHAGPHSVVYEVEPPGVGHARRALKVLGLPEAREPDSLDRLQGHVDRVKTFEHPHLERVYELGTLPDGAPFLVTEWLHLDSLDDALAHHGRPPVARAMQVVGAVAEGLAALHEQGVVHGDVRPQHVLVSAARDGYSRVVLVDSGIATRLEARLPPGLDGPLAYLSPQRIRGARPTPADDIYALGVLAWLLLVGELPFVAGDPRAAAVSPDPAERIRWLHENALPDRPSSRLVASEISPRLEAVVGRALAKDNATRYADAQAFLHDFDRAQAYEGDADLSGLFHAGDEELGSLTPPPPTPTPAPVARDEEPPPEPFELPPLPARRGPVWPWVAIGVAIGSVLAWLL